MNPKLIIKRKKHSFVPGIIEKSFISIQSHNNTSASLSWKKRPDHRPHSKTLLYSLSTMAFWRPDRASLGFKDIFCFYPTARLQIIQALSPVRRQIPKCYRGKLHTNLKDEGPAKFARCRDKLKHS